MFFILRVAFLVAVFLLASSAAVISSIPIENFPANGTFGYTISMAPYYSNRSGSPIISFGYGYWYQIVEPKFAALSDRLSVFPEGGSTRDNMGVELSCSWRTSGDFSYVFEASCPGLGLPHQDASANTCFVGLGELISKDKIVNDTLDIFWEASFDEIVATFAPYHWWGSSLRPAILSSGMNYPYWRVVVYVVNGTPVEVTSGNETINSPIPSDYNFKSNEWSYNDSIDVPNATIIQAKDDLPTLLIMTAVFTAAIPIIFHSKLTTKPKTENSR